MAFNKTLAVNVRTLFHLISTRKYIALETTSSHHGLYSTYVREQNLHRSCGPRHERQKQILMRLFKTLCQVVTKSIFTLYYSVI